MGSLDEFKVAFKEIIYTNSNSKQKNLVRYVLRKFSEHHQCKYPVDFDDLTIEHLCPQSEIGKNGWSEEIVGCIGNLIFLDEKMNGKLDTKCFLDKKTVLLDDGYILPAFIHGTEVWSPETVTAHTEDMAETAYNEIWKI